jgi:hypothetical protein
VSWAPGVTDSLQSPPQVMPLGELVTVPVPVPLFVTESVTGARLNVAVTEVAAFTVTAQLAVPEQAPLQPAKVEPAAGAAVSVSWDPGVTDSLQSAPQEMPAGELVTVPVPVPLLVTESVTVVAVAEPLTARETLSPPAVTFTLPAKEPAVVGAKRTVAVWLPPGAREKAPPETTVNGAPTLTEPERLARLVFWTVKVRFTVLPTVMLPKLVAVVGATEKSARALPLAEGEHALSLPEVSTAVTRATYVVPALRPTIRLATISPDAGVGVGDDTRWNDALGHVGVVVPR